MIGPAFFGRVDWAVSQALRRDLNVVVNVHHYHELTDAPRGSLSNSKTSRPGQDA